MRGDGVLFFSDSSGIGQQSRHLPVAVMGNPRLLQELPNIAALLSQRGGDGEQAAAADGALARLDAMADLSLNHRLAQGTYSCGQDFVYLCQESTFTMYTDATVSRMGVWSPGAGLQGQAPNHPMLLRLRGVLVSNGKRRT